MTAWPFLQSCDGMPCIDTIANTNNLQVSPLRMT